MWETLMAAPWEVLSETRERPPPMSKTSMAGPLGGAVGDLGARPTPMLETSMAGPLGGTDGDPRASTTNVRDIDGGPLGRHCRRPESATTYVRDIDGGPLGRRCHISGITHHLCQRHLWWAPLEALTEIWERPPPLLETSMVGPLGGAIGDPKAHHLCRRCQWRAPWEALMEIWERPLPMTKTSMAGPPIRHWWRSGSAHHLSGRL
jgi:hypothetical protein